MTNASARLSVIMVSYKTGPSLFDAIEACLAEPRVAELIVVNHDNPAEDVQRLRTLAEREARLIVINTGANLGFSRGCNIGAEQASGSHLLFLNPDTVLQPGAARWLMQTSGGQAEPVIIGAQITDPDGREQRGGRRGELTLASAAASLLGFSARSAHALHLEGGTLPDEAVSVAAVSGAALLMTRAGFDQLGGFDEGYFLHVEDLDLCRRARDAGGTVLFEPRAIVRHVGATSHASRFRVEHWKAAGLVRYFNTHGGRFGPLKAFFAAPLIWSALMARAALLKLRA